LTRCLCRSLAFFLLLFAVSVQAKALRSHGAGASSLLSTARTLAEIRQTLPAFEARLTPYFQRRAGIGGKISGTVVAPSEADLFAIARYQNLLSPSFKALYVQASNIQPTWKKYVSPGGNFEIYYDTSGREPVSATDTIGFDPNNWRSELHAPNGVPDYIDQVAYAADSAWSMEISGFGFVKPWPLVDAGHPSSRFKISIRLFTGSDYDVYAYTYPLIDQSVAGIGHASYIELRSEFSNASLWGDYAVHPENALRVTCCHEFFHGVQYAMTRQYDQSTGEVILDDLPASLLEGSAVLMEDLGFNYVNDYVQYMGAFFTENTNPAFEHVSPDFDSEYKNALACMYLYQFAYPSPRIDFVKNIFFINYRQTTKLKPDFDQAAAAAGRTWADLLGGFYTASYYTGPRAVAGRFIADAESLGGDWPYPNDVPDASGSVTKPVNLFSMNTFSYLRQASDNPTLGLSFAGDTTTAGDTDASPIWSVHCILKKDTVPAHDSIFTVALSSKGTGAATIAGWHTCTEALVVAVNARYDHARSAKVTFQVCGVTVHKGETSLYSSAAAGAPATDPHATVSVHAASDLLCTLTVAKTGLTQTQAQSALADSLLLAGSAYDLKFPAAWLYAGASMQLSITESRSGVQALEAAHHVSDSSVVVCRFDLLAGKWSPCTSVAAPPADSAIVTRQCSPPSPGIYALFVKAFTVDTTVPFTAYPNPARITRDSRMAFRGSNILELWIYTIDGTLLTHAVKGQGGQPRSLVESSYGFDWRLCNAAGAAVSPGIYFAHIGYKDPVTKGMKKRAQKLFVIP
jgi:hypothetical protein